MLANVQHAATSQSRLGSSCRQEEVSVLDCVHSVGQTAACRRRSAGDILPGSMLVTDQSRLRLTWPADSSVYCVDCSMRRGTGSWAVRRRQSERLHPEAMLKAAAGPPQLTPQQASRARPLHPTWLIATAKSWPQGPRRRCYQIIHVHAAKCEPYAKRVTYAQQQCLSVCAHLPARVQVHSKVGGRDGAHQDAEAGDGHYRQVEAYSQCRRDSLAQSCCVLWHSCA